VTLAAVALDPAARRMQHGRAGHNPILWRRTGLGETVFLKPPGLGLGMTPGERFNRNLKIEEVQLQEGDAIVLYSDGITEAVNATMEQFGEGRLIRAVESTDGQPAEESRAAILGDLAAFTNGTPSRDDVTLVVLRVAQNGVLT
jgi:serine phosphatase RsbU (regulator of sigma subunit)